MSGRTDFCNGDPVNFFDPDGRCFDKITQFGNEFFDRAGNFGLRFADDAQKTDEYVLSWFMDPQTAWDQTKSSISGIGNLQSSLIDQVNEAWSNALGINYQASVQSHQTFNNFTQSISNPDNAPDIAWNMGVGWASGEVGNFALSKTLDAFSNALADAANTNISIPSDNVNLTPAQLKKLNDFNKSTPANTPPAQVDQLGDQVLFTAETPGRVPGSKKVYQKSVNVDGQTTSFTKTTVTPDSSFDKVTDALSNPEVIIYQE